MAGSQLIVRIEAHGLSEAQQKAMLAQVRALLARVPGERRPVLEHQSVTSEAVEIEPAAEDPRP